MTSMPLDLCVYLPEYVPETREMRHTTAMQSSYTIR